MDVHSGPWSFVDYGSSTASSCDVDVTQTPEAGSDITRSRRLDWMEFPDPTSHNHSLMPMDPSAFFGMVDYEEPYPVSPAAVNDANNICPQTMSGPAITPSSPFLPDELRLVGQPQYSQPSSFVAPAAEFQSAYAAAQSWSPDQIFEKHAVHSRIGAQPYPGIHVAPSSDPFVTTGGLPMAVYGEEDWAFQHNNSTLQSQGNWISGNEIEPTLGGRVDNDLDEAESGEPCYAQLLFQCLKEAPNNMLSLRDIYDWVSEHSQKAKDPKIRGWQNSVRHNLSMNAAFQRVTHQANSTSKPKGSLWRLTEQALQDGVISTTRYRKDPKRKTERRAIPAPSRQRSGAKGGQATRDATRRREAIQQQQQLQHQQHHHHHILRTSQGLATPPSQQLAQRHLRRSERRHHGRASTYQPYPSAPTPQPHIYHPILATNHTSPYFLNPEDRPSIHHPARTPQPGLSARNHLPQTQQTSPGALLQPPPPARSPAAAQYMMPSRSSASASNISNSSSSNNSSSDDFLGFDFSLDPRFLTAATAAAAAAAAAAPPFSTDFNARMVADTKFQDAKAVVPGTGLGIGIGGGAGLRAPSAFGIDPAVVFGAAQPSLASLPFPPHLPLAPPPPLLLSSSSSSASLHTPSLTATDASFLADDAVPALLLPDGGESPLGLM